MRASASVLVATATLALLAASSACRRRTGDQAAAPTSARDAGAPRRPSLTTQLAEHYCGVLHGEPARKRAECCGRQGEGGPPPLTDECIRLVVEAVTAGRIRVEDAALDRCIAGVRAIEQGCDWIGPYHV